MKIFLSILSLVITVILWPVSVLCTLCLLSAFGSYGSTDNPFFSFKEVYQGTRKTLIGWYVDSLQFLKEVFNP